MVKNLTIAILGIALVVAFLTVVHQETRLGSQERVISELQDYRIDPRTREVRTQVLTGTVLTNPVTIDKGMSSYNPNHDGSKFVVLRFPPVVEEEDGRRRAKFAQNYVGLNTGVSRSYNWYDIHKHKYIDLEEDLELEYQRSCLTYGWCEWTEIEFGHNNKLKVTNLGRRDELLP